MATIGLLLAALAIILAWPAPLLLSRSRWPDRDPLAALVLWQAIGLAGGLSMIGAGLVFGVAPLGDNLPHALGRLAHNILTGSPFRGLGVGHCIVLIVAALLAVRLAGTLVWSFLQTIRHRRRHRELLALLSSPSPSHPRTRVLELELPVAYCLPGNKATTVLSAGLVELLKPGELHAVIAHERAHLRQRHDLLVLPFVAWKQALPFLPTPVVAHRSVTALVEMLADDQACRNNDRLILANAIAQTTSARELAGKVGVVADDTVIAARVHRLRVDESTLAVPVRAAILLGSIALFAVPTALLWAPMFG
ncbi:M48 family metalloprotease [Saxibacter everestensis]|uniref:M48 family metalloprotease n=1 Tax=Saxibacter everestensis TaxID=2909229 RepID=A0ABY8QY76_9MICO|nr:M48 family metalloprotease [Brevibacteriaceae bacterium ZFBP1038]